VRIFCLICYLILNAYCSPCRFTHEGPRINGLHCPLQKGIIYYFWDGAIFERNIYSRKHEVDFTCRLLRKSSTTHYVFKPRIIVPKHPSRRLIESSFVPIKGNRILLFAKHAEYLNEPNLHLSIHEIRSDNRVGLALWSFNGSVDDHFDIFDLELIKSAENALGITFGVRFDDHWKLFDISTTETDASNNFPLIESGRIGFDLKLKLDESLGLSEMFIQSC
jgi:hypothetical protein